ncbi:hypothetical protein RJT34_15794 [Clitoria ternatea]|uniref:Uncharacterized protein n=1 Tax=Clitoria ternatea TaxID=43366 RepID=A0AAN9J7I6_CLITE
MLRIASKLSSRASSSSTVFASSLIAKPFPVSCTRLSPLAASPFRSFTTGLELEAHMTVPDAIKMINYAMRQTRSEKSLGAYRLGLTVLKLCITNELTEGSDPPRENSKGMALLAMSTLMSERGDYSDAIEKLDGVQEFTNSYLGIRVAAFEAQAGYYLEMGQDDKASAVADKCMELVENEPQARDYEAHFHRARALKGLIELINGNIDSAEPFFDKAIHESYCDGTAGLSYAQFLQMKQDYKMAKEVYRTVIQGAVEMKNAGKPYMGAGNMKLEDLTIGAMCSLGQLESLLGNFSNSELHLSQALKKAEDTYDLRHPKIAVILTSIALMYRRKAIQEKSSALLVQEGLYRKVIDILKVPPVETKSEATAPTIERSDIEAFARGAYAEVLSVQENRKDEADKLRCTAEGMWKNRRMSLADALGDSDKTLVLDTRICRLL